MNKPKNFPFDEVVAEADELIGRGATVFQKFTCEKCGARQTIDVPNVFYKQGSCQECAHVTDCYRTGINYLVIMGPRQPTHAERQAEIDRNARELAEKRAMN
jgi:hypothetical protein